LSPVMFFVSRHVLSLLSCSLSPVMFFVYCCESHITHRVHFMCSKSLNLTIFVPCQPLTMKT